MRIIEAVRDHDGATLAELTEALEYGRTTLFNHLRTLQEERLLTKENEEYQIGLRFLKLGEYAHNRRAEYTPAKIQVYRLAEATNEEATFAVAENGLMWTINYVMGDANPSNPEAGSQFIQIGSSYHTHNSATGKAVLSQFSNEKVRSIIETYGLPGMTEKTITDESELFAELDRVRERGYAVNDEELHRGYRSIGVPVVGIDGGVLGAFSVGGPAYRFELTQPRIDDIVGVLSTSLERVEEAMRHEREQRENDTGPDDNTGINDES
ncbi:IclR family transcriptional regulator [Halorubrum trueperi]